jgi:hypothetical protein
MKRLHEVVYFVLIQKPIAEIAAINLVQIFFEELQGLFSASVGGAHASRSHAGHQTYAAPPSPPSKDFILNE